LLASDCVAGQASPEDDEKIVCTLYAPAKLEQMIHRGKLHDGKSVAGLLYYFRFLEPKRRNRKKS
jgi:hypothetical protein